MMTRCTAAILALVAPAFAGPLDPPTGPIAPTAKPLAEVEPRIAINATNTPGDADALFKITQPGSYYLTGNITGVAGKHGIEIAASGVTLDLNGFALVGVPGPGFLTHGVALTAQGVSGVSVRNGTIRDWAGQAVHLALSTGSSNRVQSVHAHDNNAGILAGQGAIVSECSAVSNNSTGISTGEASTVSNCTSTGNGGHGLVVEDHSTVSGCTSSQNALDGITGDDNTVITACSATSNGGSGFSFDTGSTIVDCTARENGNYGIELNNGSTVRDCAVNTNLLDGIRVNARCLVRANTCENNGLNAGEDAGIVVLGDDNRIEANHCSASDLGIDVNGNGNRIDGNSVHDNAVGFDIDGVNNLVIRNTATGNAPNYSIVAGNSVAPRVSVSASDGWAGIANANHPWANFGY